MLEFGLTGGIGSGKSTVSALLSARGMDRESIVARMETQATRDERRAAADFVIDNSGTLAELEQQVDACLAWMLEQTTGPDESSGVEDTARPGSQTNPQSAHITATGPDESSGVEDTAAAAHITATGPEDPSGPESTE